jgi:two-component system sensor histidine kinase/response regulator
MKTILLIDDDQALRTVYALVLRRNGYHVIEADSGISGFKLAQQHLPDLILSDIDMPRGDGTDLLRNVRLDPALNGKQVVLITGRPEIVTPRKGMEQGADDFLLKPIDQEALLKCMEARFNRASISWRVEDRMLAQLRSSIPSHLPHEFFTPLAGIIGLLEILRGDPAILNPGDVSDIHNEMYTSALRLHRTLRNYLLILELQVATPEAPPALLSAKEVEASVWTGINESVRQNERQKDVTVQVDRACQLSIKPMDLSRIVEELVDNGLKFSRPETPVEVKLGADGRLTVTDEGRGLTPEAIERIGAFQQFGRGVHEQQGLGLGLVLVQKLAALYKAGFSINSQPGKGTQVEITFSHPAST